MEINSTIAEELNCNKKGINKAIELFDEGKAMPFIARYRKDLTNGLDEEQLFYVQKRLKQLRKLAEAKEKAILKLKELKMLDDHLLDAISACQTISDVDDIMAPYRSKRKTRAMKARELGVQSLADVIMGKSDDDFKNVIDLSKGTQEEQIKLALDIVAEESIAHPNIKREAENNIISANIELKFKDSDEELLAHYDNLRNIKTNPSKLSAHQIHSIFRAENEGLLKLKFNPNIEKIMNGVLRENKNTPKRQYLDLFKKGLTNGIKRLLIPRAETSIRNKLKEKADLRAIEVFKQNLYSLLLEAPIDPQTIIGIDPGYKSGCKIAVIDKYSKLLDTTTIYPTPPKEEIQQSSKVLQKLIREYNATFIAIGNGTGSQETTKFVKSFLRDKKFSNIKFAVVAETGASVYSASKVAREEFPNLGVEIRGAISIARRILDPLAEYVKIDPKALGVGQYQHDVNQKELAEALDFVVTNAVNKHGINIETASKEALNYIAGITTSIAKNIIKYRESKGISNLQELLDVQRLGENTFEQCSGFLRLANSRNLLDKTMIHPDHYEVAHTILSDCGHSSSSWDKISNSKRNTMLGKLNQQKYLNEKIGIETLNDLFHELLIFGEDQRGNRELIDLTNQANSIEDLKTNDIVMGKINNVTDFGAFVDLGIKNNGLIHISKLADRFIKSPHLIVNIGDNVKIKIIEIDIQRKRIGLQLIEVNGNKP